MILRGEAAMTIKDLKATAKAMIAEGKGVLAADESTNTIKNRFDTIGVKSTEVSRRDWRNLLFSTPHISKFISGVIMFDETLRQTDSDGRPMAEVLSDQGIFPGIKVDKGAKDLAGSEYEKVTEGLDGLRERLAEYRGLGALFTKWRAVIKIADGTPSAYCIASNAHALARFAALSQEAGLVPIVEPEVLMDGKHDINRTLEITEITLREVFQALFEHRVQLEGMLLKPNMITSGSDCPNQDDIDQVAEVTVRCFRRVVPAAVPGIVFLSGGQTEEVATAHLNAMNTRTEDTPWQLSFSYGRALQASALAVWKGEPGNITLAQKTLYRRAKLNSLARNGAYSSQLETDLADAEAPSNLQRE